MEHKQKSAAIVIGLCSHGLSIVRALAIEGVDVFCIEKNLDQPGVQTNKCRRIFTISDYSSSSILACLDAISAEFINYESVVLFPSNDRHVKSLGEISNSILSLYKISWIQCSKKIMELLEKKNIEAEAVKKNLNYPKSFVLETKDIQQFSHQLDVRFPAIVKPNAPLSSFKTEIASDVQHLGEILTIHESEAPLLVQEYISGDDTAIFFCALFYNNGIEVAHICGRKIKSYPPARGQTTVAETVVDNDVYSVARDFFYGLNISGPVSLEVKKDPSGKIWIIEPTVGRTDFWSELCIASGFNLPYLEYCLALGKDIPPLKSFSEVMWYDSERSPRSFLQDVIKYKMFYPKGKKPVFSYFNKSDLKPFFSSMMKLLKRIIIK